MTVLLVDDTSVIRAVLRNILVTNCSLSSRDIHEAKNGKEALRMFAQLKPEHVFLDINMPDMSGIEVLKELAENEHKANIIMLTSSRERSDLMECLKAGAKDYVLKPPIPSRVIKALGEDFKIDEGEKEETQEKTTLEEISAETSAGAGAEARAENAQDYTREKEKDSLKINKISEENTQNDEGNG